MTAVTNASIDSLATATRALGEAATELLSFTGAPLTAGELGRAVVATRRATSSLVDITAQLADTATAMDPDHDPGGVRDWLADACQLLHGVHGSLMCAVAASVEAQQ